MSRATLSAVVLAAAAAIASTPAHAATVRRLELETEHGGYRVLSITYIDAAPAVVFTLLTDYDGFERISSVYKDSRYLQPDAYGRSIVYTRMEACLLLFCTSMTRVEALEMHAPCFIRAIVIPERSDALHGRSEWTLEAEGRGTLVVYRSTIEPSFKIPPLVGPWILRKSLRTFTAAAAERMEEIATTAGNDGLTSSGIADCLPSPCTERMVRSR